MTFRRVFSLLVLAASVWLWHLGKNDLAGTILAPISQMVAILLGLPALIAFVFNLRVANRAPPESSLDPAEERRGDQIGLIGLFLFGAMPIFIGARGVYTGVMPRLGHGPDLLFHDSPLAWLATMAVWIGGGAAVLWLTWSVARHLRKQHRAGGDPPRR